MEGVVRRPKPLDWLGLNRASLNSNNHHEYDPCEIQEDGKLAIDVSWWANDLTPGMRDQIRRQVGYFQLKDIEIPHFSMEKDVMKSLTEVYRAYLDGFDYQLWYSKDIPNGPKGVLRLFLNDRTKNDLLTNCDSSSILRLKLESDIRGLLTPDQEYFVRLSTTSGKNEKPVRPMKTAKEIVAHLGAVEEFKTREYMRHKETYLILVPWNDTIDPRCEMRIFVVNGKLTAASPQRYWELHQHTSEELEAFEYALNNITFLDKVLYKTFVADIYVNVSERVCHLIELNPFGAHSPAGSSMFNWIDDYDILYGNAPAEFRYLSAINH
jgi:hypothetical protein